MIEGIVYNKDGNQDSFPVLDALVNICLIRGKGEVVSTALQLQLKSLRIYLTIAENSKLRDNLIIYLRLEWSMLKSMTSQMAAERTPSRNSREPDDYIQLFRSYPTNTRFWTQPVDQHISLDIVLYQ